MENKVSAASVAHGERAVMCRRIGCEREVEEHLACPYCYGRLRDVASGDRARFCDFQPAKDPIVFGFPEGTSRDLV